MTMSILRFNFAAPQDDLADDVATGCRQHWNSARARNARRARSASTSTTRAGTGWSLQTRS